MFFSKFTKKIVIASACLLFAPGYFWEKVSGQESGIVMVRTEIDTTSVKRYDESIYVRLIQKADPENEETGKWLAGLLPANHDWKINSVDSIETRVIFYCDTQTFATSSIGYSFDNTWLWMYHENLSRQSHPVDISPEKEIAPGSRDEEIFRALCSKHKYLSGGQVYELFLEEIPSFIKEHRDAVLLRFYLSFRTTVKHLFPRKDPSRWSGWQNEKDTIFAIPSGKKYKYL